MSGSSSLRVERHIKIANPAFSHTSLNDAKASFGGFDFILPFASQVTERMAAGQLLQGFSKSASIDFERHINALASRICEGGANDE